MKTTRIDSTHLVPALAPPTRFKGSPLSFNVVAAAGGLCHHASTCSRHVSMRVCGRIGCAAPCMGHTAPHSLAQTTKAVRSQGRCGLSIARIHVGRDTLGTTCGQSASAPRPARHDEVAAGVSSRPACAALPKHVEAVDGVDAPQLGGVQRILVGLETVGVCTPASTACELWGLLKQQLDMRFSHHHPAKLTLIICIDALWRRSSRP